MDYFSLFFMSLLLSWQENAVHHVELTELLSGGMLKMVLPYATLVEYGKWKHIEIMCKRGKSACKNYDRL